MKRLTNFELSFTQPNGSPRMWTVLIGENGTAKTSILQAIAMAAAGRLRVNDLAGWMIPSLLPTRRNGPAMQVRARFVFSALGRDDSVHPLRRKELEEHTQVVSRVDLDASSTTLMGFDWYLHPGELDADRTPTPQLTPLDRARSTNAAHWFVAGYGVNRGLVIETDAPADLYRAGVERLRPLFDHGASLTSTGFIDIFGPRTKRGKNFVATLNSVLVSTGLLPDDIQGLSLNGRSAKYAADLPYRNTFMQRVGGRSLRVPLSGVAHGMQSTVAWVGDLVGHILYEAGKDIPATEMEGCVLVDEIDLYLHPSWQVSIVHALRETFPRIQFIVTTHSPAMLAASSPEEIVRLQVDPEVGDVNRVAPSREDGCWVPVSRGGDISLQPDPRMLTGSELYHHYFGFQGLTPRPEGSMMRRYRVLAGDPFRSDAEEAEVSELRRRLEEADIELRAPAARRPR